MGSHNYQLSFIAALTQQFPKKQDGLFVQRIKRLV